MSDAVLVERRGRALIITINRPEVRNAMNLAVAQGVADAVDELDNSPELSVAVITGAGGNFSAGMDLKAFAKGEFPYVVGRGMGFTEKPPVKPIIAAVEGNALAGGTELVLACDLIVAARNARFGLPEVKRGLVPGAGGLIRLPGRVPLQKALEWSLTGEPFTAEQAERYGLINILTEEGGALEAAIALADKITEGGPLAVAKIKEIVVAAPDWPASERFQKQMEAIAPVFASKDAAEGAAAFAERRKPNWTGE
ncbi:crotonase/enoyl-CoA hydratase family protein [Gordonia amarae]|uniref:Enoyl-CoA hydratase n=2 Tax=Gordonia amarae TaxID=36821 RepID=G7GMN7_9ACTN|nr:crotonase/enoyl-CoA hydratase family protein [Gordonia amarae]MCS3880732.1 enoyl-CoA hydratase [Gordonia amarae]QHN19025.1 crotonase/enoyl-CoA hydratase family protein [Gordonia amarae]QHN23500.1 crotonase/enoyl-CoA hydratase family protein [Gordonia amarae]QHN32400.1 crotonase/enoyl-CoA hydratase family protein [Gordonia amarae]QHN41148.1 crotonase/enoyl-CoA hydratase family protein [Gordonia amarae]